MAKDPSDLPFVHGVEYSVIQEYGYFHIHGKLIFISNRIYFFDRTEIDHYYLEFYEPEAGEYKVWDYYKPEEVNKIFKYFIRSGGWHRPSPIDDVITVPYNGKSREEIINTFIFYFKSFVEGDLRTPNWFYWRAAHLSILEKVMSRGEFLRLRISPYAEMIKILNEFNVSYIPHPRYKWVRL